MRRINLTCIVSFLLMVACDTASNVEPIFETYFTKYYGQDGNQDGVDFLVNSDGSMVLLGNSTSQTVFDPIPFIVKVDPSGNVLWQRQLGGLKERAVDVEIDNQGNLIVVSNIDEGDASRIRLFRIDQSGAGLDSIMIENGEKQIAKSVIQVSDNSFLITGSAAADPVRNPELTIPPEDLADVIVVQVDPDMLEFKVLLRQGGEYVGTGGKIFETVIDGTTKYLVFGDSDRPAKNSSIYKRSFEVIAINKDGVQSLQDKPGLPSEIQMLSTVVETPISLQEGYLMVGTTYTSNSSNIFITQYDKSITTPPRISIPILLGRRLEGVSAACSQDESFLILANEIRENNNRDIFLLRLASDGAEVGSTSFGTLEGDDTAGAVHVLVDGRIAIFGTMALETQRKMVLIILSPEGRFSD
jgi:hypothetical protein